MAGYSPLKVTGMATGLVQDRENFILPDDAYPVLQNAYVWRERILRKKGYQLLGRLQRNFTDVNIGLIGASPFTTSLLRMSGYVADVTIGINPTVTTTANHNLTAPSTIIFTGVGGVTGINDLGLQVTSITSPTQFVIATVTGGAYTGGGFYESNILVFSVEPNASLVPGSVILTIHTGTPIVLTDSGDGTLTSPTPGNSGVINYITGNATVTTTAPAFTLLSASYSYYPGLPVMGIRTQELIRDPNDQTIFFDQRYAYIFNGLTAQFQEFIPGTVWNNHMGSVSATDFFWSTNYWVSDLTNFTTSNQKLFWETNNTGQFNTNMDPIRITDGVTWLDFAPPTYGQIDATTYLINCLAFLPFRGRMVTFNTYEGADLVSAIQYSNRIRWSTIGNPFIPYAAGPPATGSWRDDIRGQGGFLDIPTNEDIVAVGFVRDNLVIYCERSTWQLRYTGRSIAPFQIERVNSELGAEGTFSAVQFDTSLVGIGDKGVVECDSYKSERIDIKIPDLVFQFQSANNGVARVHGIRDFINRLAYWTFPAAPETQIFPTQRLVYNYENDSWALFNDSLTTLGTYQPTTSRTWLDTKVPWIRCNFSWINQQAEVPAIVGGNQQGFVEYLDELTTNDVSLYISAIVANTTAPTVVTSPNHNMLSGFVIGISSIPTGTPFDNLNGGIFSIIVIDANQFQLMKYNPADQQFSTPQLDIPSGTYIGGGLIDIRENFSITSKKFNFLDEGQSIQIGYVDVLMPSVSDTFPIQGSVGNTDGNGNYLTNLALLLGLGTTAHIVPGSFSATVGSQRFTEVPSYDGHLLVNGSPAPPGSFIDYTTTVIGLVTGLVVTPVTVIFEYYLSEPSAEISLNMYLDYNDVDASNTLPENEIHDGNIVNSPDTFFNSIIPTSQSPLNAKGGTKFWQRVYCATRANFLTIQYTFSNAQMAALAQEREVQIDAQVIWLRRGGRMTQI